MSSNRILSFGLLLVIYVQSTIGQQRCRTPSGPIGQCTPFQSCDSLYNLSQSPQLTQDEYDLIVRSWCDPLRGVQMICCPKTVQTVSKNRDSSISVAVDLTKHQNVKLVDFGVCGKSFINKIAHGNLTEPFEFPWMALLRSTIGNKLEVVCGGSLISKRYVLTAAHCLQTIQGPLKIHSVVLGEHNTATEMDCILNDCADPIQVISIERQIPHPQFSLATAKNDIGLLRLRQNARFSDSVLPVCLPYTPDSQIQTLTKIIVTGWGTTELQAPSTVLLKAILDVTPQSECSSIYRRRYSDRITIDSTSLCAYDEQSDSCSGDSGGPAVYIAPANIYGPRVFQYGIVSAGSRTCGNNFGIPGLYTSVTSYMQWILDNISD